MNDRYLFKAKRDFDGQWVEGYLLRFEWADFIVAFNSFEQRTRVKTETVCQFTTLTDKNGERIWEADFVKTPTGATFVIKWVKKHGEAGLIAPGWLTYGWEPEALEVIRSIHDTLTTPTL